VKPRAAGDFFSIAEENSGKLAVSLLLSALHTTLKKWNGPMIFARCSVEATLLQHLKAFLIFGLEAGVAHSAGSPVRAFWKQLAVFRRCG